MNEGVNPFNKDTLPGTALVANCLPGNRADGSQVAELDEVLDDDDVVLVLLGREMLLGKKVDFITWGPGQRIRFRLVLVVLSKNKFWLLEAEE